MLQLQFSSSKFLLNICDHKTRVIYNFDCYAFYSSWIKSLLCRIYTFFFFFKFFFEGHLYKWDHTKTRLTILTKLWNAYTKFDWERENNFALNDHLYQQIFNAASHYQISKMIVLYRSTWGKDALYLTFFFFLLNVIKSTSIVSSHILFIVKGENVGEMTLWASQFPLGFFFSRYFGNWITEHYCWISS
jgi:hypothetical protein